MCWCGYCATCINAYIVPCFSAVCETAIWNYAPAQHFCRNDMRTVCWLCNWWRSSCDGPMDRNSQILGWKGQPNLDSHSLPLRVRTCSFTSCKMKEKVSELNHFHMFVNSQKSKLLLKVSCCSQKSSILVWRFTNVSLKKKKKKKKWRCLQEKRKKSVECFLRFCYKEINNIALNWQHKAFLHHFILKIEVKWHSWSNAATWMGDLILAC